MNKMVNELGTPMSATEQKAVPRAMDMLCEDIQLLETRQAELEKHLDPVLGKNPPMVNTASDENIRTHGSSLAEAIFELAERVRQSSNYVKKILDRLEL